MNDELRTTHRHGGFTLIEALVSISIAAGMLLMIAVIFRQSVQVTRQVRSAARVHETVRQIYEQLGRDLAGASRTGFIILRAQSRRYNGSPYDPCLCYDSEGQIERLKSTRTDMLALLASGYHTSATDSTKASGFVRVIWSHSERANGSDNDLASGRGPTDERPLAEHPEFWMANQVLARHQTLLLADLSPRGTGENCGPDYYNLSIADLTGQFWAAMSIYSLDYLYKDSPLLGDIKAKATYQEYGDILLIDKYDLTGWQPLVRAVRLGRDGPGPGGRPPGAAGSGDLTTAQVNQDPSSVLDPHADPAAITLRGYERPRVFGPADYHRLVAFGVASFQVDWTDGRRDANNKLVFYPADKAGDANLQTYGLHDYTVGPGYASIYAWNQMSPETVRDQYRQKNNWAGRSNFQGKVCAPWLWYNRDSGGVYGVNNSAWSRPKAFRVRIVLMDPTSDPPAAYQFVQTFTLLAN